MTVTLVLRKQCDETRIRHSRVRGNPVTLREVQPAVYLLASERNGTLYIGVTSDLVQRIWQHRSHQTEGFTKKYDATRLIWYELHGTMESAITREKQIKKWRRQWKLQLIEDTNPYWNDLWTSIVDQA